MEQVRTGGPDPLLEGPGFFPAEESDGSDVAVVATFGPDELAVAAAELAALVEHHRRELVDTMAELTRLQRVIRSETRAAIEAIRAAMDGEPASGPSPED